MGVSFHQPSSGGRELIRVYPVHLAQCEDMAKQFPPRATYHLGITPIYEITEEDARWRLRTFYEITTVEDAELQYGIRYAGNWGIYLVETALLLNAYRGISPDARVAISRRE